MKMIEFALVLTAAGRSERFCASLSRPVKKEYLAMGESTVIRSSLAPFLPLPGLRRIVVTMPRGHRERMAAALGPVPENIPVSFVEGGESRTSSVKNALRVLSGYSGFDFIAIHDGARPFVDTATILRTLEGAEETGGAIPVIAVTDALKRTDSDHMVTESLDRGGVVRVQTPQVFRARMLYRAYDKLDEGASYSDDADAFILSGGRVRTVEGNSGNIKITYPGDLEGRGI